MKIRNRIYAGILTAIYIGFLIAVLISFVIVGCKLYEADKIKQTEQQTLQDESEMVLNIQNIKF